ncbi:hypothetical protein ACQJBY_019144 [Aegilops geniculata]
MAVDAIAATVLPASYEFVSKHPRRRLLHPRPLNQAGRACTLAIKLVSFAYIAGRRHRLPRLRSTPAFVDRAHELYTPRPTSLLLSTATLLTNNPLTISLSCQSNQMTEPRSQMPPSMPTTTWRPPTTRSS